MKSLLFAAVLLAFTASAADVTGNWKAIVETPNGNVERTFVFKVDGSKVTGETTSQLTGKSTITDGKIEGEDLTFTIVAKIQDNEMKLNYKGKVSENEIKFHVEADGGFALDYVAKKIP